jgi:hypothetical protein
MKPNIRRIMILFLLIVLINSCKKDDPTPIDMLIGKWQLVSVHGSDTSRRVNKKIERIVSISYNINPLEIKYDSITSQRDVAYNYLLQMEFSEDGSLVITEEYRDILDNIIFSVKRNNSWHKDPFAMNPYTFYLWINDGYEPYSPYNSKIFLHPYDPINFTDKNISRDELILYFVDNNYGLYDITYTFKKL